ncbi:MAG TPA: oxidoreductase [Blastocatellia bacterium]|nr:oxidoreductase [Blastocatellia bacterium]
MSSAKTNSRVWFITGSSTGFGRELAEEALAQGHKVIATARRPETVADLVKQYPDAARAVRLDVTRPEEVRAAVDEAIKAFGRIDVLVNNAGYGLIGAIEEGSDEQIRRQFETNFFGALNVIRAVLPTLRQQKGGHILNVSSVGGFVSFPAVGYYCATKFALEAASEALAGEVAPLGIKVTIVEPGAFRTDFGGHSLAVAEDRIADYPATEQFLGWLKENDGKQPGDPRKAAKAMIRAVESENPPLRLALGADAVGGIGAKLQSVKADIDQWRQVSVDTAYEGATAGAIGG